MTDMQMKALIIDEPWISYILDGSKIWEMRSRPTTIRGQIGLIKKGSGAVIGVATILGCGHPLSPDEMIETYQKHRIPDRLVREGKVAKWNYPWLLSSVQRLNKPVSYRHKSGAVTWINLDSAVATAVRAQLAHQ